MTADFSSFLAAGLGGVEDDALAKLPDDPRAAEVIQELSPAILQDSKMLARANTALGALIDTAESNPGLVPGGDILSFVRKALQVQPLRAAGGNVLDLLARVEFSQARFAQEVKTSRTPAGGVAMGMLGAMEELASGIGIPFTDLKIRGEKPTMADALETWGVPEGARLSTGFPFMFRKVGEPGWRPTEGGIFDARSRTVGGTALAIGLDPTTYLSAGAKPIAVAREAGRPLGTVSQLTRKGTKFVKTAFDASLPDAIRYAARLRGVKLNGVDDLAKLKSADIAAWRDITVFSQEVAADAAHRQVFDAVQAGAKGLELDRGIRIAGQTLVPEARLKKVGTTLATKRQAMVAALDANPLGHQAMAGVRSLNLIADTFFRDTLKAVGNSPGFRASKSRYRADLTKGELVNKTALGEITRGWGGRLSTPVKVGERQIDDVFEAVMLHLDDPAAYPKDILPPAVQDRIGEIRQNWDTMWKNNIDRGHTAGQLYPSGGNYAPHFFNNTPEQLAELINLAGEARIIRRGANGEVHGFRSFGEALAVHRSLKAEGVLGWDLDPVLDFREAFLRKGDGYLRTMALDDLQTRMMIEFGVPIQEVNRTIFDKTFPEVNRLARANADVLGETSEVTAVLGKDGLQQVVGSLLRRIDAGEAPRAVLKGFDPDVQTMAILGAVRRARDLDDLNHLLAVGDTGWANVDMGLVNQLRKVVGRHRRGTLANWSEPYGVTQLKLADRRGGIVPGAARQEPFYFPATMADDLARLGPSPLEDKQFVGMLKRFDIMQDIWKVGVTSYFPAFHFRNHYNNIAQNFVDIGIAALDPVRATRVASILRGGEGTLITPTGNFTFQQVRDDLLALGLRQGGDAIFERLSGVPWKGQRLLDTRAAKIGRRAGLALENHAKAVTYITWLERGASKDGAAMRAHKFLFDYRALPPAQRVIIKRMFPFSTWSIKNFFLTAEQLPREIGRYSVFAKLRDRDRGPDDQALPDYMRGQHRVRLEREGGITYALGVDFPLDAALERMDLMSGIRLMVNDLAPAITTVLELATGQDFFSGRDLEERQRLSRWAGGMKALPKPVQDYMKFRVDRDPETGAEQYSISGVAALLIFRTWAWSRLFSTTQFIFREDTTTQKAVFTLLTGIRSQEVDLTDLEKRRARKNLERLERVLKQKGALGEIPIKFRPASTKPPESTLDEEVNLDTLLQGVQ